MIDFLCILQQIGRKKLQESSMRIYATADIHGKKERIRAIRNTITELRPDVLIVAGDITHYTQSASVIREVNTLPIPVLAVRGNTDRATVDGFIESAPNISSLHLKEVRIGEISFMGIGGTIPVPFSTRLCLRESSLLAKAHSLIQRHSVLVVHPPPRGILDEAFGRFHAGCKGLRDLVVQCQPRLVVCGHIHERRGTAHLGKTTVVNCSMGRSGTGTIIEYDNDTAPHVTMID